MKALHCFDCQDLVVPIAQLLTPRACLCGRHTIWMTDLELRIAGTHDRDGTMDAACIVKIANQLLRMPGSSSAAAIAELVESAEHPEFQAQRSLVVKSEIPPLEDVFWYNRIPGDRKLQPALVTPKGRFLATGVPKEETPSAETDPIGGK